MTAVRVPRGRTRLLAGVLLPAALAATALAGPAQAAPARVLPAPGPVVSGAAVASAAAVPVIRWRPCKLDAALDCATVPVPLDHDRPRGRRISVALARVPATDPAHRLGSLFVNPGGPGGSGVEVVLDAGESISRELGGRFDIVGFDPRGVARSTPLTCFDSEADQLAALAPWPFPLGSAQVARQQVFDRRLATACDRRGGAILDRMSTADVARDLDLFRAAVGDRRLNYLGFSYGTQLGTVYANLFPDRVGRMVLDGVLDPVAWTTGTPDRAELPFSTRLRSDKGAQTTLEQFFLLCDRAAADRRPATDCRFGPGSRVRYAALAAALRSRPLPLEDGAFGYQDLVGSTLGALYAPQVWRDLAELLSFAEQATRPAGIAATSLQRARVQRARVQRARVALRARLGVSADPQESPGLGQILEGFAGVACTDSRNPQRYPAWPKAERWAAANGGGYFGAIWTWASSVCQPWRGHADDRYLGPWRVRTATPVLVVGNLYDPATRYRGAVAVADRLAGSRLLTYAGWGHTVYLFGGSSCADAAISRYLLTGSLPAAGTVCHPEFDPFEVLLVTPRDASGWPGSASASDPTVTLPDDVVGLPPAVRRALGG